LLWDDEATSFTPRSAFIKASCEPGCLGERLAASKPSPGLKNFWSGNQFSLGCELAIIKGIDKAD
jgi:hypothetical protein